ncbi:MAG TPA: PASTA domain-containing protein [Vicinamibacterales bacterium]|nr:PASTA domain-containing protein [Vicinamibacterales bacterium]
MALTKRVWSAGKLLLLAGALLATYALFAAAAMRVALRTREVVLPDLRGRTVSEATAALAETGVRLRVEEPRRLDPKVGAGRIVVQEPRAGTPVRPQRSIKVWISAGARATTVPGLEGQSARTAEMRLRQDGMGNVALAEIRSSDYTLDAVVAQDPPPRTTSDRVALLVNRGESGATYVMPDLIGVNGDRAADLLRARGFRVAVVGEQPYPGVPAGVVIRQFPQGGFQIRPGEAISLEVSR